MCCSAAAGEGGGKAKGLPSGVQLGDLLAAKVEPIPATHDAGNPELSCEFFETRQVRRVASSTPLWIGATPLKTPPLMPHASFHATHAMWYVEQQSVFS